MNLFLSSFLLPVSKLRILRVERKLHKIARAKALFPFPFIPHPPHYPPQKREMFKFKFKLSILRVERKLHKIARAKALFPFPFIPHHPPQKREMFKGVGISITLKGGET